MTQTAGDFHRQTTRERPGRRELAERLILRTGLLADEDRVLMTLYLEDGHSFAEIAQLTGASATTVSRRIRKIVRRLADETYQRCRRPQPAFDPAELAIIRDHCVRGLSGKEISRRHGISYYRVRAIIHRARLFAEAARRRERRTFDREDWT